MKSAFAALLVLNAAWAAAQSADTTDKADALSAAARRGDAAAVKKLLDDGLDVNTKYRYGVTALTYACDHGHVDVVKVLLDHGADVNVKDSFYGFTPLMIAISPAQKRKPEHNDIVRLLVAKGAANRDAALVEAVGDANVDVTKILLDAGGLAPTTLSEALEAATTGKQPELVAMLEKAGAKPFPTVAIDAAQLARYAGTYRNQAGNELTFTVEAGKLTGGPAAQRFTLVPTDQKTFRIVNARGVTVAFQVEGDNVTGMILNQNGSAATYTRVEK